VERKKNGKILSICDATSECRFPLLKALIQVSASELQSIHRQKIFVKVLNMAKLCRDICKKSLVVAFTDEVRDKQNNPFVFIWDCETST
jgi:hypothetical protein